MGPYDKADAAKDTDSDEKDVAAAWHDALTDDQTSEDPSVDYGDRNATYSDDFPEEE